MADVRTSHYDIAKYWEHKWILPNGDISDGRADGAHLVMSDIAEPCCWACGKPIIGEIEGHRGSDSFETYLRKIYRDKGVTSKYNRCHIVPGALGGEDKPENLFLMCEQCHVESPDTTNPKSFFRWVCKQREENWYGKMSLQRIEKEVTEELKRRGLPSLAEMSKEYGVRFDNDSVEEMTQYMSECIGPHCTSFADSTFIYSAVDWLVHHFVEATLE